MMTAVKNDGPPVFYKRKIFDAEDPMYEGTFAVDFVVPPNTDVDDSLPIRTTYFSEKEFDGIASLDTRPIILYNARATWDCRQTVKWLRKKFPNRPLFGIGFSLGANILTNYVAEEGDKCELKAAVVISNPWNLESGSLALQRTWLGREIYSKTMGGNMKRLLALHHDEVSKNPKLDFEKINNVQYLHEFDREVQGPTWGYPTEGAYYRDASSTDSLFSVKIPFFAINAEDDPIASKEALPYQEVQKNPYTVLCTTSLGGHLSWFELGGGRWHSRPAINFLNNMAFNVKLPAPAVANGEERFGRNHVSEFIPMRRKLVYRSE
ncbi:putative esterase [Glarea lozoyensis 74030]|uniref:Putative esterase n=1 Tax=Glarea lozoyensis (strain ATCC 74030 / MF5533) TaxID=1104152 RepID=H0EIB9_GLAL7|nr:putative esterase [Glarea lozoyensis 74030]